MLIVDDHVLVKVGIDVDVAIALMQPQPGELVVHVRRVLDGPPASAGTSAAPGFDDISSPVIAPAAPQATAPSRHFIEAHSGSPAVDVQSVAPSSDADLRGLTGRQIEQRRRAAEERSLADIQFEIALLRHELALLAGV